MILTTKAVRGLDPRTNVYIDGVYMGVIRQIYGHADKTGRLHYVYDPTEDSPIPPRRSSYSAKRLGLLIEILRQAVPS